MDDLDFVPSIASDEEIVDADYVDDASQFDGERSEICMDVIIDRGVLDCCQHWFCFTCVDNWSHHYKPLPSLSERVSDDPVFRYMTQLEAISLKRNHLRGLVTSGHETGTGCGSTLQSSDISEADAVVLSDGALPEESRLAVICRNAETELAVVDAVTVEKGVADLSSSKLVYVNLCSQTLLCCQEDKKSSDPMPSHPLSSASVAPDKGKQEVDECPDSEISGALRAAGLLSYSPPNSPLAEAQPHNGEPDLSMAEKDEASDNVVETSGTSDIDVCPDIKGDLVGEEHLRGTGSAESSNQPPDDCASTNAAASSTNYPENPASFVDDTRETEQATTADEFLPFKNETATQTGTSLEEHATATPRDSGLPSAVDKPVDPSLIACDGSCAPGRESPRNKECDEVSNMTRDRITEAAEADGKYCNAKPSPDKDAGKFPVDVDSIRKKVEAYLKEHIRPLCKSGVINAEQYRWSVTKTAEKVTRYHSKAKNASFSIKEGEKVKRLAEQYVKAA